MSANPIQPPNLRRGALVSVDATTGAKRSLSFQYSPSTLRRTLEPNTVGGQPGTRSRAVRYAGAPNETISFDCRLAADDDAGGIAGQLAALALLAYPKSTDVIAAQQLLDTGAIEVLPALADGLLLVFGSRVIPCQLLSTSIVEELYDSSLEPVLATVSLTLRVMSYSDVDSDNRAYAEFMTYQQSLEQLAGPAIDSGGPG